MIITDLEAYRQDCGMLLRYIADPAKTKISEKDSNGFYSKLEDLYGNICRGEKNGFFVTGINVAPDTAEEEFSRTQILFPTESGNSALHAVQSFEPGEISAEEAHAFGIRLACAFCKEGLEAVVATHTDHSHIHNHIVTNAVSWKDGNEVPDNKNSLRKLRKLAAELAPSFGIFKERKVFPEKEGNEAQRILKEVNEAVALSRSFREFRARMAERGYAYSSLEEPVLYLHNGESVTLGEEYSEELLRERIHETKDDESRSFIDVDAGRLHGIQILYFRFLCRLNDPPGGRIPEGFSGMKQEKEHFEEEVYFLIRNGICEKEDLEREKENRISKYAQCKAEKDVLSSQIHRCTKAEKKEYLHEIRDLLKQDCDVLQNEIALCNRIEEHTGILEETLRSYDKVKTKEKDR